MTSLALAYGLKEDKAPAASAWPTSKAATTEAPTVVQRPLPAYLRAESTLAGSARSLKETLERDAQTHWEAPRFGAGSPVGAEIKGAEIAIRCLPIDGRGNAFYGRYSTLGPVEASESARLDLGILTDTIAAAFGDFPVSGKTDWAGLHPVLLALFSLLRPRRCVVLGIDTGESFFAACEASENFNLTTQCVAVDAWIGEENAFERFRRKLEHSFRNQHFIRGSSAHALQCFDDGSVDLLHVDTYYSYGASVEDFASWLPKMSSKGTIIFHDVDVYRRECGLWRLWADLKEKYPAYSLHHSNGLAILYVGDKGHRLCQAIDILQSKREYVTLAQLFFAYLGERSPNLARGRMEPFRGGEQVENVLKFDALLKSHRITRTVRRGLRRSLFATRTQYVLTYLFSEKRTRYAKRKRELKDAIGYLDRKIGTRNPEKRTRRLEKVEIAKSHEFVVFDKGHAKRYGGEGLHPNIRLIIPTRGCAKWLPDLMDAYRAWRLEPTFAVDEGCEPETLAYLKQVNASTIFIDMNSIRNGEAIMPYLSRHIDEDYILRLDDDEFPTKELIAWASSIPDSQYAFVTSWWLPRYEVAMIDGKVQSCHYAWMRTIVGSSLYENLHGGRFYRHRDVTYGKIGAHHANFISDYVSHAPADALMLHLDYILRSVEERLDKIRIAESRWKDAGWPLANYMMPELAPRELLHLRDFNDPELQPLIGKLVEKVYRPTKTLTLGLDEIVAIQRDRLADDTMHFHY